MRFRDDESLLNSSLTNCFRDDYLDFLILSRGSRWQRECASGIPSTSGHGKLAFLRAKFRYWQINRAELDAKYTDPGGTRRKPRLTNITVCMPERLLRVKQEIIDAHQLNRELNKAWANSQNISSSCMRKVLSWHLSMLILNFHLQTKCLNYQQEYGHYRETIPWQTASISLPASLRIRSCVW